MKFATPALSALSLVAPFGFTAKAEQSDVILVCQPGCIVDADCEEGLMCHSEFYKSGVVDSATIPGCDILDFGSNSWCVDPDAMTEETKVPTPDGGLFDTTCNDDGTTIYPHFGEDSAQRMLLREGAIDAIPEDICTTEGNSKNVILVIGDGMGWEMVRAGAIARQILNELASLGCDTMEGCPDNEDAMTAFEGRTLADYYTEGTFFP